MERRPAREPARLQPRARRRDRACDRLRTRRDVSGAARRGLLRHRRLCAHRRRTPSRHVAPALPAPYRVPNIHIAVSLVLTNKTPVGTYRGPGRYEADFFRERLIDMVADDLGLDRVELRRRHLIPESAMPYRHPTPMPLNNENETESGRHGATT